MSRERLRRLPSARAILLGIPTPSARAILIAVLTLAATACQASQPKPEWLRQRVEASSERVMMDVTVMALEKCSFPVGTGIDPAGLVAVSGWRNSLAPFRGKGYRERCEVRYSAAGPRTWNVSVRVQREKNDDIVRPLDLTYAQWEPEADDPERAAMVLQYIRSLLGTGFQVGDRR